MPLPDHATAVPPARHILHVDMDAFYAAVEQLDRPELRGKPVLVGGSPHGRGVVTTASYEARPFGCHSAMPMARAVRLCPHAIVVPPRFERYGELSARILTILESCTPLVEPLSIDEAFLDVSGSIQLLGPAAQIAAALKQRIRAATGLTASVGLAPNKFVAKLASDHEKPDGLVVVTAAGLRDFLDPLPVARLWGVGPATLPRFTELGVQTFADARRLSAAELRVCFGAAGEQFYQLVRGRDDRPVVPDRAARSISHETTFPVDVDDPDELRGVLLHQLEHVAGRLRRHGLFARAVQLKIRSPAFVTRTRRTTLPQATDRTDTLWQAVAHLYDSWAREQRCPVRLIGVGLSQLSSGGAEQLALFDAPAQARRRRLDRALDTIRRRFGRAAIARGGPSQSASE